MTTDKKVWTVKTKAGKVMTIKKRRTDLSLLQKEKFQAWINHGCRVLDKSGRRHLVHAIVSATVHNFNPKAVEDAKNRRLYQTSS